MLEPYDGKLSRTVLRREGGGNTADPADYAPLVERLHGQVIHISPASTQYINPLDVNSNYSEEDNPLALKADFVLSLCELIVGGKEGLQPVEKTVIDRCVHTIYRKYFENPIVLLSKTQWTLRYHLYAVSSNFKIILSFCFVRCQDVLFLLWSNCGQPTLTNDHSPLLSYMAQFRFSKIEIALFCLHELFIRRICQPCQ